MIDLTPDRIDPRYELACFARHESSWRHLAPIASAGGWPLVESGSLEGAIAVVAFASDEPIARKRGARGTILCEHGAGQSYLDPSLPADSVWRGGRGPGVGRVMFLAPGALAARRHRKAHPRIPVHQIGCPMLDAWHGRVWQRTGAKLRVAISTHWACNTLPETLSAWPWLREHLQNLTACQDIEWLGHYHPHERLAGTLDARLADYDSAGIEVVHKWEDVLERADVFVGDNSSTLYEFAATGRPVVCLNPPWYRRSARHGLRFWKHAPGIQVDDVRKLLPAILMAADDAEPVRLQRSRALFAAYGRLDGQAAARAADAINAFLKGRMKQVFTTIYRNNGWQGTESVSGRGSDSIQTRGIRSQLPALLNNLGVKKMLDLPCGDFNWMAQVDLEGIEYIGADIVAGLIRRNAARHSGKGVRFRRLDLAADKLPRTDLILCRDCLVHFSLDDVFRALKNICASGSKYLLTTTFPDRTANRDIVTGAWRPLNLQVAPFSLPPPLALIVEGCTEGGDAYKDKSLGLWRIEDIRASLDSVR
jgi:hypothetical protein